ncbi:hypothetical protein [Sorangium sp. So ce1335]|uniref:hypothetical protein n=1 Tax=Sorangium sp. So ce1335 TaxID=3133335 RepID=UPI003F63A73E
MARHRSRHDPSLPSPEARVRVWDSGFGALRLIERTVTTPEGRSFTLWGLHPDDARKLPPGAVRADASRQVFGLGGPDVDDAASSPKSLDSKGPEPA